MDDTHPPLLHTLEIYSNSFHFTLEIETLSFSNIIAVIRQ